MFRVWIKGQDKHFYQGENWQCMMTACDLANSETHPVPDDEIQILRAEEKPEW